MAKVTLTQLRALIKEAIEEMGVEEDLTGRNLQTAAGSKAPARYMGGSLGSAPKERTAKDLSLSAHDKYMQMQSLLDTLLSDELKDDPEGQAEVLQQIQKITSDATKTVMQEALRRRRKMLKNR
jgi:hypothetical protein